MAQNIWLNNDSEDAISAAFSKLDEQYYHQKYGEDDGSYRTRESEDAIMQLIASHRRLLLDELEAEGPRQPLTTSGNSMDEVWDVAFYAACDQWRALLAQKRKAL